jgi:hypothetical protein
MMATNMETDIRRTMFLLLERLWPPLSGGRRYYEGSLTERHLKLQLFASKKSADFPGFVLKQPTL